MTSSSKKVATALTRWHRRGLGACAAAVGVHTQEAAVTLAAALPVTARLTAWA